MFVFLAKEETKHKEIFRKLYEKVGDVELPAWAEEDEYVDYLKFLLDSHTLFRLGDVDHLKNYMGASLEAIETAMGFEKDTIMFFVEMHEFVPDGDKSTLRPALTELTSAPPGQHAEEIVLPLLILVKGPWTHVRGLLRGICIKIISYVSRRSWLSSPI